jgi:hypothetical protein
VCVSRRLKPITFVAASVRDASAASRDGFGEGHHVRLHPRRRRQVLVHRNVLSTPAAFLEAVAPLS